MIDQVPGYRILERAGEGGFSVVYRAHQERLDRVVALKVLSVDAVDSDTMRRFERECQITGRLTGHPNVVTVLDTGITSAGRPFIAMDYFERGSLRDRLTREGPLPVPDVLRVGVKIAGALAATHEAEVLHRDVKPQNILVSKYGEPALADFGVARLIDSSEATHTNAFTPYHAAPEVVNGQAPGVTSDIYALASSMYQLLAGGPAFKSGTGSGIGPLMMRILNEPPPPIRRPDVPPQLYEVIAKAMAKSPENRYPTAVAFANRLQQLQAELRLPVTELAGSDSLTLPPAPAPTEIDHSGLTGPGFDLLMKQYDPRLPASHPDAAASSPVAPHQTGTRQADPRQADPRQTGPRQAGWHQTGPGRTGPQRAPSSTVPPATPTTATAPTYTHASALTGPREVTPRPLTAPAGQDLRPAPDQAGRRGGLLAGALAVLLLGTGLGVGAFLVLGNSGSGRTPGPSPTPTSAAPSASGSAPAVPSRVLRAAMPRDLQVAEKGPLVTLRWKLAKNNDYPIVVQQADANGPAALLTLPPHTMRTTITDLDPAKGYCFTVGAIVAYGKPSTVSWAKPAKCIRGARISGE